MILLPAYGRDYRNKASIQADLDANKDFILADITSRWDGKPINQLLRPNSFSVLCALCGCCSRTTRSEASAYPT